MPADPEAPTDPAAASVGPDPKAPFKRLPIRMQLYMDQRWITHLISECASQPLQVEVTELRINPPEMSSMTGMTGGGSYAAPMGGGGSMFGTGDRDRGMMGGRGGGIGGMGGMGASSGGPALVMPNPGELKTFKPNPNLVNVEVLGIIYIFNAPNPTALDQSGQIAISQ
jgi:hypothetical protein